MYFFSIGLRRSVIHISSCCYIRPLTIAHGFTIESSFKSFKIIGNQFMKPLQFLQSHVQVVRLIIVCIRDYMH